MPYQWSDVGTRNAPLIQLRLWPNQTLAPRGFVAAIALAASLMALPLLSLIGKSALWMVLGFLLPVLAGLWLALRRNQTDLGLLEELQIGPERLTLTRREVDGSTRDFEANPYWLVVELHPEGRPVEDYLTLRNGPRIVELGAFLAPEERRALADELREKLVQIGRPGADGA